MFADTFLSRALKLFTQMSVLEFILKNNCFCNFEIGELFVVEVYMFTNLLQVINKLAEVGLASRDLVSLRVCGFLFMRM